MPHPKVSIIVPCYNSAEFISRCIKSILAQTFSDYELIIIDDGSTDTSSRIISQFVEADKRVKYFYQENAGPSSARNHGISVARGEWVTFIDSDDYIRPDYINNFFSTHLRPDIFCIQGFTLVENTQHNPNFYSQVQVEYNVSEALVAGRLLHNGYASGKLYYKENLVKHGISFDTRIHYKEDLIFLLEYLSVIKYVRFIPAVDYFYCRRTGSLSWSYHRFEELCIINSRIIEKLNNILDLKSDSAPSLSSYIESYDKFCLLEMLESLYRSKSHTQKDRIRSLQYLRNKYSASSYPFKFKSDKIFKYLYKFRLYSIFDSLQVLICNIRCVHRYE